MSNKLSKKRWKQKLKQIDPEKYNLQKNGWRNGGERTIKVVLDRDKHLCVLCGMAESKHIEKYGCKILIHHLDNNGRNNDLRLDKYYNNETNNLVTLCTSCHTRLHCHLRKQKTNSLSVTGALV